MVIHSGTHKHCSEHPLVLLHLLSRSNSIDLQCSVFRKMYIIHSTLENYNKNCSLILVNSSFYEILEAIRNFHGSPYIRLFSLSWSTHEPPPLQENLLFEGFFVNFPSTMLVVYNSLGPPGVPMSNSMPH